MQKIQVILHKLAKIGLHPAFGAEIEFYILNSISDFCIKEIESIIGLKIQKEEGKGQYEIATDVFFDVYEFMAYVEKLKRQIIEIGNQKLMDISLHPKPLKDDYGSAMHIHMSLYDINKINVFNNGSTVESNTTLLNTIGGILHLLDQSLYMLIGDDKSEIDRLNSGMMAPRTISWGKNNRTTAIRIPDSPPFNRNRRIELRVTSAKGSIYHCVIFLLTAAFYGISNNINPGACFYGDANDLMHHLKSLNTENKSNNDVFTFWRTFEEIISK